MANCPFLSASSVSLAWPPKSEEKGQSLQDKQQICVLTGELKSTPAFLNSFTRFSAAALNSELAARRSMVIFDGTPWLISTPVTTQQPHVSTTELNH